MVGYRLWKSCKTGIQTGIGTAIPAYGEGAGNGVDAFGTALIWAEASVMITVADVVVTKVTEARSFSKCTFNVRSDIAIHKREALPL